MLVLRRIHYIYSKFGPFERFVFVAAIVVLVSSSLLLALRLNRELSSIVPAQGGSLHEGIIGTPRFVNPLLDSAQADRDIVTLVFSGLMRATPDGSLVPDLAERYSVSDDGKTYTFTLRDGLTFHDSSPLTSQDIEYTILRALDPETKSPRRVNWEGVHIERPDDLTIVFTLRQPYAPFLESTTLGILPKHLWETVTAEEFPFSQLNSEPVGSGPYSVRKVRRDNGTPAAYELASNTSYVLGEPRITKLILSFYQNEASLFAALQAGEIESASGLSHESIEMLAGEHRVLRAPLPRLFAVFFNHSQGSVFLDSAVREALTLATDRNRIIQEVLGGYGVPVEGPLPPGIVESSTEKIDTTREERLRQASSTLAKGGWKVTADGTRSKTVGKSSRPLAFTLATSDVKELVDTARILKENWNEIGVHVDIQVFEAGDLNHNVIRPRKFDALLFGQIIGPDLDLYAFWHSSQRIDPGLNIALYTSSRADKMLESARATLGVEERAKLLTDFAHEIKTDNPAVFIYAPEYLYVIPSKLEGVSLGRMSAPQDRFLGILEWNVERDRVWHVFAR